MNSLKFLGGFNEDTLRLCLEHVPVAIAMLDSDLRYMAVSRRWVVDHRLGDETDIIGRKHREVLPRLAENAGTAYEQALSGEVVRADARRLELGDGKVQWLRSEIRPWYTPAGDVGGIIIFNEDVTARKEKEQALRDSEDRLRSVVETAVEAIITIDRRGIVQTFNRAAERMFGYTSEEVIGHNVSTLMPPPYRDEHDGYLERYLRTGEARIIGIGREVTARRKDGSVFPISLAVSEIEHLQLFTGIIHDLSARKEAEERLRQADRLSAIGTLAAGLGHDMNNILLPVRSRLDVLDRADLPAHLRAHFIELRKSAKYLQDLADALHLLALDPNDAEASTQATDINEWWRQTSALLARALPKHVRFSTSLPSHLPEVRVPPHRLTQALLNLLVNAAKAVAEGGKVRLWAESDERNHLVRLGVTDNGCGMAAEVRRRALEPFFTTKTRGLGTGLGLSLVHGVVQAAGGSVEIESEPGKGTTITLAFPALTNPAIVDGDSGTAPTTGYARVSVRDRRIRSLVTSLLEMAGFDLQDGLQVSGTALAVLVTDDCDEAEGTASQIHLDRKSHVIFLGSSSSAMRKGHITVVEKPDDFTALRDAINEVAEGAAQ